MKTRASEQDSPIPDTFTLPDLIDLIDKVDIEKAEDKKTEAVWRITKCIKHLCCSEETLRWEYYILRTSVVITVIPGLWSRSFTARVWSQRISEGKLLEHSAMSVN